MATPYSQIVGTQAMENVVSGERYKKITDETIKYALEYYGKPVVPLDENLMDKIMSLPRTKEFIDWKPEGFLKSVEEIREEIGPELSDDDLLLKVLIPGQQLKRKASGKQTVASAAKASTPMKASSNFSDFPREFSVDVDGEVFNVKISPVWNEAEAPTNVPHEQKKETVLPVGAVVCCMAGLVLSIDVAVGDPVAVGDQVATIEAMKMRRQVQSSQKGVVREIRVKEGEIVDPDDVLMVVS